MKKEAKIEQQKKKLEKGEKDLKKIKKELKDKKIKIMKTEKDLREKTSSLNWFLFTWGYLDIAKSGCEVYLSKTEEEKDFLNRGMIISIVFNIKHALEIIIKNFSNTIDGKFDKNHNIDKLFENFKKSILKKITKSNKVDYEKTKEDLEDLSLFVNQYFESRLFQKHFKNDSDFIIEDPKNTFLRYPENNESEGVSLVVDFQKVLDRIEDNEINEIKDDIEEIQRIMFQLRNISNEYKIKIN